jgi:hypothetical protein
MPATAPEDAPTVATPVALLVHTPPVVVLARVTPEPAHTAKVPVMASGCWVYRYQLCSAAAGSQCVRNFSGAHIHSRYYTGRTDGCNHGEGAAPCTTGCGVGQRGCRSYTNSSSTCNYCRQRIYRGYYRAVARGCRQYVADGSCSGTYTCYNTCRGVYRCRTTAAAPCTTAGSIGQCGSSTLTYSGGSGDGRG